MDQAKIRLSAEEQALVENADWILTKNEILNKVNLMLVGVQEQQELILKNRFDSLPIELRNTSPKISRGENYLGLPYLILDYPRNFGKEESIAIRTMFWWGHFFSVTLHISGNIKKRMEERLLIAYGDLFNNGVYVNINEDEWQHHLESNNYIPANQMSEASFHAAIIERNFIKLTQRVTLENWDTAPETLMAIFEQFIRLIEERK
jgi:hypothetical protein